MSENRMVLLAADAAGQPLRVGDLAGGVRLKPQPHTIIGKVRGLGKERAKLLVTWSSNGTSLGQEESVYLNRTFRLASDGDGAVDASATRELKRKQLANALHGKDDNQSWLELIAKVIWLRDFRNLDIAIENDDQLTDADDGSILSRTNLKNRYRAMISSVARRTWTTVPDELVDNFLDGVMQLRDHEVRLLRMRLRLPAELHQAGTNTVTFGTAVDMINPHELDDAADYLENHDPGSEKLQRDLRRWAVEIRQHNVDELSRLSREMQRDAESEATVEHPSDCGCNEPYPCGRAAEPAPNIDAVIEEIGNGIKSTWSRLRDWLNDGGHR